LALNRFAAGQRRWFDAIRKSLSRDLLDKKWQGLVPAGAHRVTGHCYIATEAAYHAFGREAGFYPHVVNLSAKGQTHWWLARPGTGEVIDLTHEQTAKPFNYARGVGKTMRRGKGPDGISLRAGVLLARARQKL
jgi:hypothetical protein